MGRDDIVLSTGRVIYANRGLISTTVEHLYGRDEYVVCDGYDGEIFLHDCDNSGEYKPGFTKAELIELADIGIEKWNVFKRAVMNGIVPSKESE